MEKVIFSEAEKEIMENLQETMGLSAIEAADNVVRYKRNLALYYEQKGNFELAKHLLIELGEWDDSREQKSTYQDIIMPE